MEATPQIAVTLTPELLARLRAEADSLAVPIEYVVASLVLDTIDAAEQSVAAGPPPLRAAG